MGKTNPSFRYTVMGSEKLLLGCKSWGYNVHYNVLWKCLFGSLLRSKTKETECWEWTENKTETICVKHPGSPASRKSWSSLPLFQLQKAHGKVGEFTEKSNRENQTLFNDELLKRGQRKSLRHRLLELGNSHLPMLVLLSGLFLGTKCCISASWLLFEGTLAVFFTAVSMACTS